jgi:predicted GTPase
MAGLVAHVVTWAMLLVAHSSSAHTLIVGGTGVGKTHLCNVWTTTWSAPSKPAVTCGQECRGFQSCTRQASVRPELELIDTPGFGDSRGEDVVTDVDILVHMLNAVDGVHLRAVLWIFSCGNRPSRGEVASVDTLYEALGAKVPVIPVFACSRQSFTR